MIDYNELVKSDRKDLIDVHMQIKRGYGFSSINRLAFRVLVNGRHVTPFPVDQTNFIKIIENLNKIPLTTLVLINHSKLKKFLINKLLE